jgi:hypothetical protein
MNLAEHYMNAIEGLCHSSIPNFPQGAFYYFFPVFDAGGNSMLSALPTACSYRSLLLNTAFIK